eukprot:CAMPEP_0178637694 /NCGR_PEP_ID=MMETSP0698-20121128/14477_1 /TAXON_ID=265572 /ORGANISM="Extubocellulus spinifer, Strain CCMP396" /LENGTH=263 /DNA_ID=CAMNT_0020277799 /DNA_START=52 /DNA_END=843 /DNA_ORIENTATION=+
MAEAQHTGTSASAGDGIAISGLNEALDTNYLDLQPEDQSLLAKATRLIAGAVGKCFKPRQILVILRLLKAITFCFLILTICADIMYIVFVEFIASNSIGEQLGGVRDTIIRVYGIALAVLAVLIELDVTAAVKYFSGLKSFIPRGLLLFFVAMITCAHPLQRVADQSGSGGDDDAYQQGDDYVVDDDATSGVVETPIPYSAVAFQMVVSWVLAACALVYLVLGCFCFDRFTSRAFLSQKDPITSTAIPHGGAAGGEYDPPVSA